MELVNIGEVKFQPELLPERTSRLVQMVATPMNPRAISQGSYFHLGLWDWYLYISCGSVALVPNGIADCTFCIGSFTIRLLVRGSNCPAFTETAFDHDFDVLYLTHSADIMVPTEGFIIEVEFYDLKSSSLDDGEPRSIWTPESTTPIHDLQTLKGCILSMLDEELHTDITITTSDLGVMRAHRAILATRSIVFDKMFTHNMRETLSSTFSMMDVTLKECRALLSYIYGNLQHKDLEEHASALLKAAIKYDMADLKEVCKAYLMEGINTSNVLSRLQDASDHELHELKRECKRYLLDFGKIGEMKEEVSEFIRHLNKHADDELGVELVEELITRMTFAAFQGLPFDNFGLPVRPSNGEHSDMMV